ncbi:cation:proton antiporter [Sandaracinus amylolyticus]|uniref:cation:proton antiporter domain-containing protein n=1 Tax=Sandaracinus amylolyticus TaxID=927083 RepID=UPI001F00C5B3|nr:cation:proton antiporter [Sandaracinus amylolyticus]UJR79583.1 Kef-type K+ transport system membrane component KefB [Sandaracinus amylolyticus]
MGPPASLDLARVLLQVVVILAVSRALAPIARRLGQPAVVAEMVAGIVLGPSLLGWIAPPVSAWLFPPASLYGVRLLSQLGLVLFMFLVGLELDPKLLHGRGRTSIAVGIASLVVPLVLGIACAPWLHARYGAGSAFAPFALFLSAAASVTAFPVLARILSERHLLTTRVGAIAIACAAVDDVGAWCLVTLLLAAGRAPAWIDALRVAAVAIALVALMLFVLRPVLVRVVRRVERKGAIGAGAVTAVLFPLLLVAATSELLGVHALFGAFLVGAVLPKDGPLAEVLAEKLETITVGLLLPLFFAHSGLRTELALLDSRTDWLVTAAIVVLATGAKLGGSALVARASGWSWRDAGAVGILLNTRGLMGLIVLNVGLDLGVVSTTVFTMLVIMALVTTLATSPLLRWVFPDRAAIEERFVDAPPRATPPSAKALEIVLACVSDPRSGPALAAAAHALVGERAEGARVFGLHLAEPSDRASAELRRETRGAPPALTDFLATARGLALDARALAFVSSAPADDIVRIAEAKRAGAILLGGHEPWFFEGSFDGVVAQVVRRARTTVAVLVGAERAVPEGGFARILVADAGAVEDGVAVEIARRLGARAGTHVTCLAVGAGASARALPEAWSRERASQASPRDALLAMTASRSFDLVVLGLAAHWRLRSERAPFFARIGAPVLVVHDARALAASAEDEHAVRERPAEVSA